MSSPCSPQCVLNACVTLASFSISPFKCDILCKFMWVGGTSLCLFLLLKLLLCMCLIVCVCLFWSTVQKWEAKSVFEEVSSYCIIVSWLCLIYCCFSDIVFVRESSCLHYTVKYQYQAVQSAHLYIISVFHRLVTRIRLIHTLTLTSIITLCDNMTIWLIFPRSLFFF